MGTRLEWTYHRPSYPHPPYWLSMDMWLTGPVWTYFWGCLRWSWLIWGLKTRRRESRKPKPRAVGGLVPATWKQTAWGYRMENQENRELGETDDRTLFLDSVCIPEQPCWVMWLIDYPPRFIPKIVCIVCVCVVNVCVQMCVWYACIFAYMCRVQRWTLIISCNSQWLSTISFDTDFSLDLQVIKLLDLFGQWAPGICLALPVLYWDYRNKTLRLSFHVLMYIPGDVPCLFTKLYFFLISGAISLVLPSPFLVLPGPTTFLQIKEESSSIKD